MSEPIRSVANESDLYNIRHGVVEVDVWQRFEPGESGSPAAAGNWLVPAAYWVEHRSELTALGGRVGVLLTPDDEVQALAGKLGGADLVAVEFPSFTDGRGFSLGYLVRTRLGWRGELRAVGDVLIDTIHYLARCGFDSFTLKPGHDPAHALRQFQAFNVHYQKQYVNPAAGEPAAGEPVTGVAA